MSASERFEQPGVVAPGNTAPGQLDPPFRMLVPAITAYATFLLDADGSIASWDGRAQRMLGHAATEILGRPYSCLFTDQACRDGNPARELEEAKRCGSGEVSGWRVRRDGSAFLANVLLTALHFPDGRLRGYASVTHELSESVDTSEQFRMALEAAPTGMIMVDENGLILLVNAQVEKSFGYARRELIGRPIEMLLPARVAERHAAYRDGFAGSPKARPMGAGRDLYGRRKDGTEVPVEIGLNPMRAGGRRFVLGSIVDITERKRAEIERERLLSELRVLNSQLEARVGQRTAELRATLKEREVLLQEVHHRVKNNLQIISSLINMQMRTLQDGFDRDALAACQTRIQAIALIHEKLHQSKDHARVPFADYARSLASNVFQANHPLTHAIALELDIAPAHLGVERAIPCGLILNELITNALKHGFPTGRAGVVVVEFHEIDRGQLSLVVRDNGVGIRPEIDIRRSRSLGMQLVCTLADQLEAEIIVTGDGGSCFRLIFPAEASS